MDVFPIFLLQGVGDDKEEGEEDEDIDTQLLALQLHGFASIGQEGGQIARKGIELLGRQGAAYGCLLYTSDAADE